LSDDAGSGQVECVNDDIGRIDKVILASLVEDSENDSMNKW